MPRFYVVVAPRQFLFRTTPGCTLPWTLSPFMEDRFRVWVVAAVGGDVAFSTRYTTAALRSFLR